MLLVIDNFDSFTYNLVQYFGQLGVEQRVFRNNEITPEQAVALNPDRVLLDRFLDKDERSKVEQRTLVPNQELSTTRLH